MLIVKVAHPVRFQFAIRSNGPCFLERYYINMQMSLRSTTNAWLFAIGCVVSICLIRAKFGQWIRISC